MCAIKRQIEGIHGHTVCIDKGVQLRRVAGSRLVGMISGGRKGPGQCSFEIAPKRDAFLRTSNETVLGLLERAERAGPCALGVEIAKPSSISPNLARYARLDGVRRSSLSRRSR